MDNLDRAIINRLQDGFPLCEHPFQVVAEQLGTSENELINRLDGMVNDGLLSRFGPLFNAEKMGGELLLCAMSVSEAEFDDVADVVNSFSQVAHNYQRQHRFNMWFVLATESAQEVDSVVEAIERKTGLSVHRFPKLDEYYVGLKLAV